MRSSASQNQKGNNLTTNQEEVKNLIQNQEDTLKDIQPSQKGKNRYLTSNEQSYIIGLEANQKESKNDTGSKQQGCSLDLEANQEGTLKNPANYIQFSTINLETNLEMNLAQNQDDTSNQHFNIKGFEAKQQNDINNLAESQLEGTKDTASYHQSQKEGKISNLQNNVNDLEQNNSNHTNDKGNIFVLALEIQNMTEKDLSLPAVKEILLLLQQQQSEYQNIKYLGHSEFSLVLQARKSEQGNVALKISPFTSTSDKDMKKQQAILKLVSEREYFVKVNQIFYLHEQNEEQKLLQNQSHEDSIRYTVVEMEICQSNLRKHLQHLKDQNIILSEIDKQMLAVQIIDSINLIHSKNILHRNIKLKNFLVQQNQSQNKTVLLKLSGLGQASRMLKINPKSKKETSHCMSEEALNGQYRVESDLFQLGIVLLELDNYDTLDCSSLSIIESLQKEGIVELKSHNLNTKNLIFQVFKILLDPEYRKRSSAKEILAKFLAKQECQNVPLYSVITQNKIDSLVVNSSCRDASMIKKLNNAKLPLQLSIDQIRRAVAHLYKKQTFSLFSVLGCDSSGVVFSVINLKHNREVVLKISLVSNKQSTLRQIEAMSRCRSPYIVDFKGYEFFKDESNTEYVVFEFEKCSFTLTYFLEQQTEEDQYPQETKDSLALQIIDSIALLHQQNVLHGDIKLEDFLIEEDEEGRVVAKLANFGQSGILNPYYCFNEQDNKGGLIENINCLYLEGGSLEYFSPERYHTPKHPTTKLSDGFSVGICLLLLDNYLSFSNEFCSSHSQLLSAYEKPYKNCIHLFNLESNIYKWAQLLLSFDPEKRLFPSEIVNQIINSPTPLYSKWNNKLPLQKEYLQAPGLLVTLKQQDMVKMIEDFQFFSSISTSLSSLKLDLKNNQLASIGFGNLLKSISSLSSLSSLEINLCRNQIGNEGVVNIQQDLSALTSLSSLKLALGGNKLTSIGVGNLLKSISSLSSLSFLKINLNENQIENEGVEHIQQVLSTLTSLSSLNLDLRSNKLTSIGVGNLLKGISSLSSLLSLEINMLGIYIGKEGEANIQQNLSTLTSLSSLILVLGDSQLTSIGVGNLLKSISSLSSLSFLEINLNENQIGNEGEANLSQNLSTLTQLSSLILALRSNKLISIGFGNLLKSISSLSSLASLNIYLNENQIGNEGEANISQDLSALTSLYQLKLDLMRNKLTSIGFGNLLKSISSISSLSSLEINLCRNQIGNEGETNIQQDFSALTQLYLLKLDLMRNQLTSIGVSNLLKSISSLSSLLSLEINLIGNQIGNEGEANISLDLSTLTSLCSLKLYVLNNKLTSIGFGNLLKSISSLSSLSSLEINLSRNQIGNEGEANISQDLYVLISLSSLKLALGGNQLTSIGFSNLLKSISSLSSLSSLEIYLNENQIGNEGEANISQDLSALTSLYSLKLDLMRNKLTSIGAGNLLKSISSISSLSSLEINLRNNQIEKKEIIEKFFSSKFNFLITKKLNW